MVPGRGNAPCRPCDLERRIARRIALNAEVLDRPWLRALFLDFCAWEGLPWNAPTMPRRIGTYARCFAAIGEGCAGPTEVRQECLLALMGAEGLRRNQLIVRFLVGRLSLDWDPAVAEAHTEGRRIETILAAADGHPWGPALRAYSDRLALDRALHPRTVRFYLNAAASLLTQVGHADLTLLQQAEVDRYLRRRPGQRASLARFLTHAIDVAGVRLVLSGRQRRADPKAREKALLRDMRELLSRLDRAGSVGKGRAVLATIISKIYAIPLLAVLGLKAPNVSTKGATITLWADGLTVELAPALAGAMRHWASWDGGYLFPGRNGAQPLSSAAVRHHVPA